MQVNSYQVENVTNMVNGKTNETKTENKTQTVGFFEVAMEKSGLKLQNPNICMNYGKNGEVADAASEQQNVLESKQDVLEYIKQNIEKLKDLVTNEDFSAMSELGLAADKESPDTLVTVNERIRIQLAAYCDDYDASGMNISSEKMQTVLGSQAMVNAVKMAQDTGSLDDAAKSYLLKNELEPSINNVYKASHSTQGTDTSIQTPVSGEQWEALKPQISDMLEKSGLEATPEHMEQAKWLMDHQVPVTTDNVLRLEQLNQVDLNNQDVLQTNIAYALMFGMDGTDAFVTEGWIQPEEANDVHQLIENVSDEVLYDITRDQVTLNAANIKKYEEEAEQHQEQHQQRERNYEDAAFVKAKQVIIEARLVMTSASLVNMQKLGISITYTEISVMVSAQQREDRSFYSSMAESPESVSMEKSNSITSIMEMMKSMSQIPSVVLGDLYQEKIEFSLSSVYEESNKLAANYSKAELTYEAVGTQIRPDLGDSIEKAFDSIDDILEEEGIGVNESSRRAARILGYNSLEITRDSIMKMESLMSELDFVRDNLTPKTAVHLVENEVNILNTDIRELNEHLIELNSMIGADETEDFAKYLWKLEKKGEISREDREAYIDLYRTLNMVEKEESSSIGAVVAEGAEFTLNNLLSAVKSRQKQGMDVTVDETFGLLQPNEDAAGAAPATEEIGNYVKRMASQVKQGINGENVEQIYQNGTFGEISLGNLVDVVSDNASMRTNARLNAEYVKTVMETYLSETTNEGITEDVVLTLMEGGHKATMENIITAMEIATPGSDFRKYLLDKQARKRVAETAEEILNKLDNKEEAKQALQELKEVVEEETTSDNEETDILDLSYEKIKASADIMRNVRFMVRSAEQESFHVPMEISGEAVDVRVTFVHKEAQGHVSISTNTLKYGMIQGNIQMIEKQGKLVADMAVSCRNWEGYKRLEAGKAMFVRETEGLEGVDQAQIHVTATAVSDKAEIDIRGMLHVQQTGNEEKQGVETSLLYQISKSFLKTVKECL